MPVVKRIGRVATNIVVDLSKKIKGQHVGDLVVMVDTVGTFDKLVLSASMTGKGMESVDLLSSVPVKALANRSDYFGGAGYVGGTFAAAVQVDDADAGASPITSDKRIVACIDIGRFNLSDDDELELRLLSTSALSSEDVSFGYIPGEPALERLEKFTRNDSGQFSTASAKEVWVCEDSDPSVDPYEAAAGDLTVNISRKGQKNIAGDEARELFEIALDTAAKGRYELGVPTEAFCIFDDVNNSKLEALTISYAGAKADYYYLLVVERYVVPERARLKRNEAIKSAKDHMSHLETTRPQYMAGLRNSGQAVASGNIGRK